MHKRWYIVIIILLMAEMKIMWLHRADFFFNFSTWTGSACVQDLIGLILYKYTNQGLQPPLKVQNVSYDVALYKQSW